MSSPGLLLYELSLLLTLLHLLSLPVFVVPSTSNICLLIVLLGWWLALCSRSRQGCSCLTLCTQSATVLDGWLVQSQSEKASSKDGLHLPTGKVHFVGMEEVAAPGIFVVEAHGVGELHSVVLTVTGLPTHLPLS